MDLIDKEVPFLMSMNLLDIAALALMVVVICLPSAYFILIVGVVVLLFLGLTVSTSRNTLFPRFFYLPLRIPTCTLWWFSVCRRRVVHFFLFLRRNSYFKKAL